MSMLKFMRQHATSWFIKIALGLIIIVFIFWGVGGFRGNESTVVAKVGNTIIDVKTYQNAYQKMVQYYQNQYKAQWDNKLLKLFDVKHRVLNQLIDQVLIAQEARRLHITVSPEEVAAKIESMPVFRRNGHFSRRLYLELLRYNRVKPADFEQSTKSDLLYQKVKNLIAVPASYVTTEELNSLLLLQYEKRQLSYVRFLAKQYLGKVKITEADLRKYYDAHKEIYRQPEKIAVSYLLFQPKDFTDRVKVSEKEIEQYYQAHEEAFRVPERIRARHILIKVPPNASKEVVEKARKRAIKIEKLAKSGKDFAKLAKKYSQGPSAKSGGDLGYFTRGMMVKPFEKAVFSMHKGEISGPVRTRFGFHIIKVEDIQPAHTKPLKEVRDEIMTKLKLEKAQGVALDAADKAYTVLYNHPDLVAYAKKNGLKVYHTGPFSREARAGNGIIPEKAFVDAAFGLQKGKISTIIALKKGYCLMNLDRYQPSKIPALKEVEAKVKEAVTREKALSLARDAAVHLIKSLEAGTPIDAVAQKEGLKVEKTKLFGVMNPADPNLGEALAGAINEIVLLTRTHPVISRPLPLGRAGYAVCILDKVVIPKLETLKKKELAEQIRRVKGERALQSWLEFLRKKTKIEIHTKVLNSFS